MAVKREAAARGSFLVLGVEPPTVASTATAASAVLSARPRSAPHTVRLLPFPPPSGSSPLAEVPPSRASVLGGGCVRPPSGCGEAGGLSSPGQAREVTLVSELGRCQVLETRVTVNWCSWGVFRGALLGASVTLRAGGVMGSAPSASPPPLLPLPCCVTLDE